MCIIPPPKKNKSKTLIQKDICTTIFIAALFTIARIWKQPKSPSTGGLLFSHKENEIVPFSSPWMILDGIMINEKMNKKTTNI